jgi:hypothetical protein
MSGSIDNVLNINGSPYPPAPPPLSSVMSSGNSASTDLNMASYSITNVNTINGYSPVTLGLTWGDFAGNNAYNNLPNQAYQVASGAGITSQFTNLFEAYDNSNYYGRLFYDQLQFYDNNTGTSTSYAKTSINNADSNPFTITAGLGASQPLNLNCSQLYINGNPFSPTTPVGRGFIPWSQTYIPNNSVQQFSSSGITLTTGNWCVSWTIQFDSNFTNYAGTQQMIQSYATLYSPSYGAVQGSIQNNGSNTCIVASTDGLSKACLTYTDYYYINSSDTYYPYIYQSSNIGYNGYVAVCGSFIQV